MACTGCSFKNKGDKKGSGGCSSGGCNKLNTFDWLSNMDLPRSQQFDLVELRFKNGRKEIYRNADHLELYTGDAVMVEIVGGGVHLGTVSLQGEMVRIQMLKKNIKDNDEIKRIIRKASDHDVNKFEQVQLREMPTMYKVRQVIKDLNLDMKLSDVEYQADNTKATFYYSAEDRVDFRELIKLLATEFKVRIEMKQISLRQEAGRLGGVGSCGRELCCSTWLTSFKSVSTTAARYQNLSLNPAKLSGQCGRLKCCLNYELDTYVEALKDIPTVEKPLETQKGRAILTKTDIFRKVMWFAYHEESVWHPIPVTRVREILILNQKGVQPATLTEDVLPEENKKLKNEPLLQSERKMLNNNANRKRKRNKKRGGQN